MRNIRNFSIIAHIDHGKSTLSDRLIEMCGGLDRREMSEQVLDSMDLERERGITIKAQSVSLEYRARDGQTYMLNFIDTPGHVDFSYEVSRSLAACEGALLIVDAAQSVEAQTVANCYTAVEQGLEIVPVINKIDLPSAEPDRVLPGHRGHHRPGRPMTARCRSARRPAQGVDELLERFSISPHSRRPSGNPDAPLQALIIDSWFDNYVGVVSLIRIVNGSLPAGQQDHGHVDRQIPIWRTTSASFTPKMQEPGLHCETGEVGYLVAGIKDIDGAPVGDTITILACAGEQPLPGFGRSSRAFSPACFRSSQTSSKFRDALQKLRLNDAALHFEPESSAALGFGFRCGFLGMLHMEIVQERLEREYGLSIITTAPTVAFEVAHAARQKGETLSIDNPAS